MFPISKGICELTPCAVSRVLPGTVTGCPVSNRRWNYQEGWFSIGCMAYAARSHDRQIFLHHSLRQPDRLSPHVHK